MVSTNSVPSTFSWGWAQTMTGAATVNVAANPSVRIARFMISWPLGRFELCSAAGSSHPGSADGAEFRSAQIDDFARGQDHGVDDGRFRGRRRLLEAVRPDPLAASR